MKNGKTVAAKLGTWLILCCLLTPCAFAQPAPASPAPVVHEDVVVPATIHGAIKINDQWRFQVGDDPAWADPNFDDSAWTKIDLTQSFAEQGIEGYTGYAWYRLRLRPAPVPDSGVLSLALLVVPNSVGQLQVIANGVEVGRTQGMRDRPAMYQSPPFKVAISQAAADGTVVVAIRSWAG